MRLDQITAAPIFPGWVILLLLALALAAVFIQFRLLRRRLGAQRSLLLSVLRLIAIVFIIAFALNPSWMIKKEHQVAPSIGIYLDSSQTMALPGLTPKSSRLDQARGILLDGPRPLLKALAEKYNVRLYGVGESVKEIKPDELSKLQAQGANANMDEALNRAAGRHSVAVLLSDGHVKWGGSLPGGPPVLAVPLGNPADYKDLLIKAVKAPALAFRGREVSIDVTIKSYGYAGLTLPVLLKEENKLLTAKNGRIRTGSDEVTLSLSFTPETVGQRNLSVSIPPQYGEASAANNQRSISIKVVGDKIRILMVSGNPSMNYRFMRAALKNDPSIDLLSFVILRAPSNILNVPTNEQSLIPFPVDTLFSKEIKDFDLLIFDNFKYPLYLSPHHLESIRDFVKAGGGFAVIGGPNIPAEGMQRPTAIGEILPVKFVEKDSYHRDSPAGVRLSPAGAVHPLTRLSPGIKDDESDPAKVWQSMPSLDGMNLWEAKSSATVLLESGDRYALPVLAVWSYGKGRVLALGTDYSWKWDAGMVSRGQGNLTYLRFQNRMVRWLTKDPSLDPVQITLPENAGDVGREVELRVKLREEDLPPNLRSTLSFSVFSPEGIKIPSKLRPAGQPGESVGSFLPLKAGVYKIKVESSAGTVEENFVVSGVLETIDGQPDHDRLKAITEATGGKLIRVQDEILNEVEAYAKKEQIRFVEESRSPMWATAYMLFLVLACLIPEWYLRRRWGLI